MMRLLLNIFFIAGVYFQLHAQSDNLINSICSYYLSDKEEFNTEVQKLIEQQDLSAEELSIAFVLKSLSFDPTQQLDSVQYFIDRSSACATTRCKGYIAAARARIPVVQEQGREAIDLILESIHYLDPIQDQYMYMIMNQSAAGVYYWMSDFERANKYVQVALQNAMELKYTHSIAAAYDLLANGWSGTDDIKADSFRQLYYQAMVSIDDFDYQFEKLINQGFSLQNKDYDDSARVFFQLAFDMAKDSGDVHSEIEALTYLAENSFWRQEYHESRSTYETIFDYPEQYYDDAWQTRIYDFWSQTEAGQKNYKTAYEYMRKYKEIDDAYWDYTSKEKTAELEAKYENARKETQLAEQELEITQRTAQRNLAYGVGIGLLAIGAFFFYRNRKN